MDDAIPRTSALNAPIPNNMDAFWMPFTANRQFKENPRLIVGAEGMYYHTHDGRTVIDGTAGLWCVNAGHKREPIIRAIQQQAVDLDYAPSFQMGHPRAFDLAARLTQLMPGDLDHVFFTNSGSESVDTALKIALAYHNVTGNGNRTRMIGREKGYHGVGFGGISVGGIVANRKHFGHLLAGTDHMRHTHDLEHNAFSRGQPKWGAHLADDLERMVQLHDASTIACVIVEPFAGSGGVYLPPVGYLERLREICDKYGILLIFDEVITGFGRLGAPFATEYFGVQPDIITTAKGITNGCVPMGAVFVRKHIFDAFMTGDPNTIELFHGYTYSAHPLACAAAHATLDVYQDEGLLTRGAEMAPYWDEKLHSLADEPHVIDIRAMGLVAGVEFKPKDGHPTKRAYDIFLKCYQDGLCVRFTGNTIALTPPLIIEKSHIDETVDILREAIRANAD